MLLIPLSSTRWSAELHVPLGRSTGRLRWRRPAWRRLPRLPGSRTPPSRSCRRRWPTSAPTAPVIGLPAWPTCCRSRCSREGAEGTLPGPTICWAASAPKAVETALLERFPWIDVVAHGEGERSSVELVRALRNGGHLDAVPGVAFRRNGGGVVMNPPAERIEDLSALGWPALDRLDYSKYAGHNLITSRGCPYLCTFCSVAPVWGHTPHFRDPHDIVAEMAALHRPGRRPVPLPGRVLRQLEGARQRLLRRPQGAHLVERASSGKAFARVNLATTR